MATVQTVLGPVDAATLGFTLSHEHVTVVMGAGMREAYPFLFDWEATRVRATRHLKEAKAGGVDSIIELSTPDLGRDVELFARVAEDSGVTIVCATGIWRDPPRMFWDADPDWIAEIFVREIREGIASTGIRAGAIKVANDAEGVTPAGERVLRAAARAVEIFQEEGVPMHLVCVGHSADTTDVAYLEELLATGCYLSMDRYPGAGGRPDWRARNTTVRTLVERGHAGRLMLGHDFGVRPVIRGLPDNPDYDPSPTRYLHLSTVAIPAMRADGVTEEQIREMTVNVPRRFLTGEQP